MGSVLGIVVAAVVGLTLVACGSSDTTTIIKQTTTVSAAATTTSSTTQAESTDTETSDSYSGPCGEPGMVTGGVLGTAETAMKPGFTNVRAMEVSCRIAESTAQAFIASWKSSCADGCTINVNGFLCKYDGGYAGGENLVPVNCFSAQDEVRFDLVFPVE